MPVTTDSPDRAFRTALEPLLEDTPPRAVGVAVSGGGDSMALLHLAADWCRGHGIAPAAATVDHGLRPEAGAEAAEVARVCAALGVPHRTLEWRGWDGQGNLQDAARQARRQLLAGWAQEEGLDHVLLGHTADDQAETFLMRLARGSGVDGLACMAKADRDGLFLRPLLTVRRAVLRDWLRDRGIGWAEDPSNDDPRFDRVKARRMLEVLAPLGLTVERLVQTADHMTDARLALQQAAFDLAAKEVREVGGDLILSHTLVRRGLGMGAVEGRIFAAAVQWIGASPYRPRLDALTEAVRALRRGETRTLGGVLMLPEGGGGARLCREAAAVAPALALDGPTGARLVWDGRWTITRAAPVRRFLPGKAAPGPFRVQALGEAGLGRCKAWRDTGLPRLSLLASPSVWQGETLVAAPLAGFGEGWTAETFPDFATFLLSH